ncbi:MAG TPA: hypothetical protein PKA90_05270 [Ignavibacteria bacterium]|nr:hypothetical protein [Ignavibacteria bacterium]HMR39821.1 hypothetical protein [Ignavibacteria bacterium]
MKLKKDYLNYLFFRTKKNLTRYQINPDDSELIKNIFRKIINSENPHASLFILYNIKEFKNLSKYMIFILKKLEDDVINFENLLFNLENDSEFIQNEILSYLSNPERKVVNEIKFPPEIADSEISYSSKQSRGSDKQYNDAENYEDENISDIKENISGEDAEEIKTEEAETEETEFRKNYLELIKTEEKETGIVYELPGMESGDEQEREFNSPELDLPDENFPVKEEDKNSQHDAEGSDSEINEINERKESNDIKSEAGEFSDSEEAGESFSAKTEESHEEAEKADQNEEVNISGFISEEELIIYHETGIKNKEEGSEVKADADNAEESDSTGKIQLSNEIQEELDMFDEAGGEENDDEDDIPEQSEKRFLQDLEEIEPEPANTLFVEYESEVRDRNRYLSREFDNMIKLLAEKSKDEEERTKIILSIIETSGQLEELSRKMSLEVISNIYQTITLSFEKISDAKYDITESTLNLFKKGLTLVISLINGDNYFGYKDILKSIENIRNTLIEEKQKRETYLKRLQEKLEMDKNLDKRFPDETAKNKITLLKKYIKDTESNFHSLENISGEYQIYEALRSLSGSLNNFKDIVKVSKELKMMKLVQLAEAGYIFVKFLQNYRINPVTDETKEIFGYIVHNLKLITMGRDSGDVDLFISYLNDPVKIFSNTDKKKN